MATEISKYIFHKILNESPNDFMQVNGRVTGELNDVLREMILKKILEGDGGFRSTCLGNLVKQANPNYLVFTVYPGEKGCSLAFHYGENQSESITCDRSLCHNINKNEQISELLYDMQMYDKNFFYSDFNIVEVRDYQESETCVPVYILLKSTNSCIFQQMNLLTANRNISYEEQNKLEAELVLKKSEPLCLCIDPLVTFVANRIRARDNIYSETLLRDLNRLEKNIYSNWISDEEKIDLPKSNTYSSLKTLEKSKPLCHSLNIFNKILVLRQDNIYQGANIAGKRGRRISVLRKSNYILVGSPANSNTSVKKHVTNIICKNPLRGILRDESCRGLLTKQLLDKCSSNSENVKPKRKNKKSQKLPTFPLSLPRKKTDVTKKWGLYCSTIHDESYIFLLFDEPSFPLVFEQGCDLMIHRRYCARQVYTQLNNTLSVEPVISQMFRDPRMLGIAHMVGKYYTTFVEVLSEAFVKDVKILHTIGDHKKILINDFDFVTLFGHLGL